MADAAKKPIDKSRRMKYPYTMGAKLRFFPYKFYYQNSWFFRWLPVGFFASLPVFMYISSKANSPENVAYWAEKRRKEALEHAKH